MNKSACCLLAGALLAGSGAVGTARAETLEDVLATAYNSNPTLMARRAQLRATDEGVPEALSGWRPTVTLQGSVARVDSFNNLNSLNDLGGGTSSRAAGGTQDNIWNTPKAYGGTLTQQLYNGGQTVAATRQAEASVLSTRAQLDSTEEQVLLQAATAFLNVVRDQATVKLSINNEQVLRRQLEATQERFRVGEITRTDVSQAEARLAQATADRIGAEGALQNSRAAFIDVVGRPPESPQAPSEPTALPGSFDEVKTIALAHNPNVVAADWTAKAAEAGVDVVRGKLLPSVSASLGVTRTVDSQFYDNDSHSTQAMLNLSVPLYQSGSVWAQLRAQKQTYGQRLIEADQSRRDALQSANQAWETLRAARARVKSYSAQIAANQLALTGVEEEAKVGARTVLDTLNAEQELFTSRVNLVTAQHDEMVAAFQLDAALGRMTAEGLHLPVDIYDPRKHYDDVRDQWIGGGIDKAPGHDE